jgi:cyd operon protein YbgT
MWYFSWILGVGLACSFAILNAMWFEMREDSRVAAVLLSKANTGGRRQIKL